MKVDIFTIPLKNINITDLSMNQILSQRHSCCCYRNSWCAKGQECSCMHTKYYIDAGRAIVLRSRAIAGEVNDLDHDPGLYTYARLPSFDTLLSPSLSRSLYIATRNIQLPLICRWKNWMKTISIWFEIQIERSGMKKWFIYMCI